MGCGTSISTEKSITQTRSHPALVGNYKGTVHDEFLRLTAGQCFGRDEIVEGILTKHITTTNNPSPLLLFGESGSGKSSILAELARRCMKMAALSQLPKTTPGHPWRVFYHFIGSVPGSTDLFALLRRLLFELQLIKTEWDLPTKLEEAIGLVCSALSKPSTESYIIIIDAINQVDEINDRDAPISWLPVKTAPNVRVVVSSLPDTYQFKKMRQFYSPWTFTEMSPMTIEGKRQMIRHQLDTDLGVRRKKLNEQDVELLASTPSSDSPMWLVLAVAEICHSEADEDAELNDLIKKLPKTLDDLESLALERIERGPLSRICVAVLCLIECSVNGLDLEEIYELLVTPTQLPIDLANLLTKKGGLKQPEMTMEETLAAKEKKTIANETWQIIERNLGFYVRMFIINAKNRLDFFHLSFAKTVRQRYMLSTKKRDSLFRNKIISSWFHDRLCGYFGNSKLCDKATRRCECYPTHAYRCMDVDGLIKFLCDWQHFDAMFDKDFSRPLNKAWTLVYNLKMKLAKVPKKEQNLTNSVVFQSMQDCYLAELEKIYPASDDESYGKADKGEVEKFVQRLDRVAQIFRQNGCFESALKIADRLVAFTCCYIGKDGSDKTTVPLRSAAAMYLKAQIIDAEMRSGIDFMNASQLEKIGVAVQCFKDSIEIFRKFAPIDDRIGKGLNRLGFLYSGIDMRGGMENLPSADAKQAAIKSVEDALGFYMPMKDQQANLADCYITRGICEGSACDAQIDYYSRALNNIVEEFGYFHPLLERVYLNTGIYFEESGNLEKAYDFFYKWHEFVTTILGPTHPTTMRAIRTLREENYTNIAKARGNPVPEAQEEIQQDAETDSD